MKSLPNVEETDNARIMVTQIEGYFGYNEGYVHDWYRAALELPMKQENEAC